MLFCVDFEFLKNIKSLYFEKLHEIGRWSISKKKFGFFINIVLNLYFKFNLDLIVHSKFIEIQIY